MTDRPSAAPEVAMVHHRLASVAATVAQRFPQLSNTIWEQLLAEIPELRGDDLLERMLSASVAENVAAMLHIFEHRTSPDKIAAPTAAAEYARRLAQRDVSVIALVRAYRVGHARFLRECLTELAGQQTPAELTNAITHQMLELSFAYIDRVSQDVVGAYQHERDRWLLTQTAVRSFRVKRLLTHEVDIDASEAALGYRLRQNHLALIGWVPEATAKGEGLVRLDRLALALAADLGCRSRPLFVPHDEAVAWIWLPLGPRQDPALGELDKLVQTYDPSIRVGVGEVGSGIDGFRDSHHQAVGAQTVSLAAQPAPRVTLAEQVGPIALLCGDLAAARTWVRKVLGGLAVDGANQRRLRETLRVFLEEGSSYSGAAELLNMHRNTVQYRVHKARELLPSPVTAQRSDLELALRACHHLGSTLLIDG